MVAAAWGGAKDLWLHEAGAQLGEVRYYFPPEVQAREPLVLHLPALHLLLHKVKDAPHAEAALHTQEFHRSALQLCLCLHGTHFCLSDLTRCSLSACSAAASPCWQPRVSEGRQPSFCPPLLAKPYWAVRQVLPMPACKCNFGKTSWDSQGDSTRFSRCYAPTFTKPTVCPGAHAPGHQLKTLKTFDSDTQLHPLDQYGTKVTSAYSGIQRKAKVSMCVQIPEELCIVQLCGLELEVHVLGDLNNETL